MKTVIGLTGTTGSGKSTVSEIFTEYGFYVINCDIVARYVVENDNTVLMQLIERFGKDIINSDGLLNRRLLASKAFADSDSINALNNITLPAIINEVNRVILDCESNLILLDAPTLFESGADKLCSQTVCVVAPTAMRIERIIERDNISRTEAEKRISAQHTNEFFEKNCTYIINNSGDLELLRCTAKDIANLIMENSLKG